MEHPPHTHTPAPLSGRSSSKTGHRTVGTPETLNPWWPQSWPLHPAISGTRLGIPSLASVLTAETLIPTQISASRKGQLSRVSHLPPPPLTLLPPLARPDHCHPAAEISPVTGEVPTPCVLCGAHPAQPGRPSLSARPRSSSPCMCSTPAALPAFEPGRSTSSPLDERLRRRVGVGGILNSARPHANQSSPLFFPAYLGSWTCPAGLSNSPPKGTLSCRATPSRPRRSS